MWLYDSKINLSEYLDGRLMSNPTNTSTGCKKQGFRLRKYQKDKNYVPINDYSIKSRLDWLSGLIDSDGTSTVEGGLQIVSIDFEFLRDVQYLLSTLGVNGKVCSANKEGFRKLPDGNGGYKDFFCKESGRILVSAHSMQELVELGLNTHRVNFIGYSPNRNASRFVKVESIELQNELEDFVYCFNEPKEHKGIFNGILTGQCGEIPLCPYDSCRLLAINLYSYVDNPFTPKSKFNFELFRKHVQIAQKIMDDIVDLEIEKIDKIINKIKNDPESEDIKRLELELWEKIKDKAIKGRRTGLGITAEGDMLAALGLRYGTKEATDFSVNIHKELALEAYKSSIDMARVRGAFPIFDRNKEGENPFVFRVMSEIQMQYNKSVGVESVNDVELCDIQKDYINYGRRNIALLTIAPTGTTSLMTQTTSGIEPVFLPVYKRRRKTEDPDKCDFKDEVGDMWEEYNVFHHKFVTWLENKNLKIDDVKKYNSKQINELVGMSPYYKATSNDIDWMEKVRMQGEIQKWVDHSISVTINLPKDTKKELISDLYFEAWKSGCKGVTVYRDGSRSGVLVSTEGENKNINGFPEERPKEVKCEINHLTIKGVKWVVLIGLVNNNPYEVFCLKEVDIPKKYKTGVLSKIKSSSYDLKIDGDGTVHNITQAFENPLEGALTRQLSLNLKHTPLEDIYLQLQKEGDVSDFNKAISRVFKKYLKDKKLNNKCPECSNSLVMQDGCVICNNCGYSLCG